MKSHSGRILASTWMPRPPEVFGKPVRPASASTSRSTPATRTASAKSVPGCGSRSIRSSSGWSTSGLRTGHGWKSNVPRLAAHASTAGSVGQTSSAVRPDGNVIFTVSTHSGAPLGTRLA